MKLLNENKITNNIMSALKESSLKEYEDSEREMSEDEANQAKEIASQIKNLAEERDRVDVYPRKIDVSFKRGDVELYGTIVTDPAIKTTKLAIGSGPNPLTPEFVELLNQLSGILQGYTHENY